MNCSKWNAIFYERDCPCKKTYKGFRFLFCPIFVTLFKKSRIWCIILET
jgi:hypothetical protein